MSADLIKKVILPYSVAALLVVIALMVTDLYLRIATGVLLVIYVAVVVYIKKASAEPQFDESELSIAPPQYKPNDGESFTIVPNRKNAEDSEEDEIITGDKYVPEESQTKETFALPADLKQNYLRIAAEACPPNDKYDEQFSYLLDKFLTVMKEVFDAHTAIFFWYDKKKEKLTLEKFISSSKDLTDQKFGLEDDILSQIILHEEPQLLTEIPQHAETDVIRYYRMRQGIKSFVGVPLYYGKKLAGVLALDSKAPDAFGVETIYSLAGFVRIVSLVLGVYDERHKEMLAEKKLKGILRLISGGRFYFSDEELFSALESSLGDMILWDAFTFIYYEPNKGRFKPSIIKNKTQHKYISTASEVEISGTLVGKSIMTGTAIKIDDSSPANFVRYFKKESIGFEGSFMAVPLVYDNQNFGVLCFENENKNAYTKADVMFMKNIAGFLAFVVYSYSTQSMLRNLIALDIETRALNSQTFYERLNSEIAKCGSAGIQGAVALIHIDKFIEQDSLFEGNPFPKVLSAITKTIASEMTPLNLFGRINERTFAVHFFNSSPKDVFLWAEKLRVRIARMPVEVGAKQSTFTVSVGVASIQNRQTADEVLADAELALQKAIEKGGNTVRNLN